MLKDIYRGETVAESIPDGAEVMPINDITTWLKTSEISKQYSYTTIEQVIADSTCTESLMNNENAMKYLARSTEFADAICASETTMTYLGQSAYVDDTVLNSDLWKQKIKLSQYWTLVYASKTVTVYGGAYETITIEGYYGSFTTNADGSVSHVVPIDTIILTGSVSNQSFTRTVTIDTIDVYVMPEGTLYWYGNECTWITGGWSTPRKRLNDNGHTYTGKIGVKNTNYLSNIHDLPGSNKYNDGFETVNSVDCSGYSKLNTISKVLGTDTGGLYISIANNTNTLVKNEDIFNYQWPTSTNTILTTTDRKLQDTVGYGVFVQAIDTTRNHALYAMWLE